MTDVLVQEEADMASSRQPEPKGSGQAAWTEQDLAEVAANRERRYQSRAARITANRWMDDRLKALLLERQLVDSRGTADVLGVTAQRIAYMRLHNRERRPTKAELAAGIVHKHVHRLIGPHPSLMLEADGVALGRPGKPDMLTEIGRLREFGIQSGRLRWSSKLGKLVKRKPRGGRPRKLRVIPELGKQTRRRTIRNTPAQ